MAIINVSNRISIDETAVGAIVCHTPKTTSDNSCKLVSSIEDIDHYFGDPFINPTVYSDLSLAYDLVRQGVSLYISSVQDVLYHEDGFNNIKYNGYTEFFFKRVPEEGDPYDIVGYKLKSNIKFCQPLIQRIERTKDNTNIIIYVQLYYIDRDEIKSTTDLNLLYSSYLYKTIQFTYRTDSITDELLISDFHNNGFELQIDSVDGTTLSSIISEYSAPGLSVLLRSFGNTDINKSVNTDLYWYTINSSDYQYNLPDELTVITSYYNAIDSLSEVENEPLMLCVGRLYKSLNIVEDEKVVSSQLSNLNPETTLLIYNHLLDKFSEDCNTYLFINAPDIGVSSTLKLLNRSYQYTNAVELRPHYNCDLFFGYAVDFVDNSLTNSSPRTTYYSAALLTFYNLMLTSSVYVTNSFVDLNISNRCVKLVLSERSADKLKDAHCNSMVLFDIGSPSSYGDRSLSRSPNLQYSHVSRNFVRIRRLISEYLERKKFIINTKYNIDTCSNYIKFNILNEFVSAGIISDYSVSYTVNNKTVYFEIVLLFNSIAESITINFII